MSRNQVIVVGLILLMVIGFVRILEQPDAPDDPLAVLFRTENEQIDPTVLAACAALQDPIKEALERVDSISSIEPFYEHEGGCVFEVSGYAGQEAPSTVSMIRALFEMLGWKEAIDPREGERAYVREPVTCFTSVDETQHPARISIGCIPMEGTADRSSEGFDGMGKNSD